MSYIAYKIIMHNLSYNKNPSSHLLPSRTFNILLYADSTQPPALFSENI